MDKFSLERIDGRLCLVSPEGLIADTGQNKSGPVFVDFLNGTSAYRIQKSFKQPEILLKALGAGRKRRDRDSEVGFSGDSVLPILIDATAGLGEDSFLAAHHGFKVLALEKNDMVFKVLQDGITRLKKSSDPRNIRAFTNFEIKNQDFLSLDPAVESNRADVIYLDPMFPEKNKSSLPKKEMQALKFLVGMSEEESERDTLNLFEHAMKFTGARIVVKRPLKSSLVSPSPQGQILGKMIRFDIYKAK